uniref:Putative secreted protein n=1 Tax=Ixodes ricinus TaxID=34613 RepID=A0A0K8R8M0_IXORI
MLKKSVLAAALGFLALASAHVTPEPEDCPELPADWTKRRDNMLAHLPERYNLDIGIIAVLNQVEFGNATLTNMSQNLELDSAFSTFCYGDKRLIVIGIRCRHECLRLTLSWSHAGLGLSGEAVSSFRELELQAEVAVTETEDRNVYDVIKVTPRKLKPRALQIPGFSWWVTYAIKVIVDLFLNRALPELLGKNLPAAFRHAIEQSSP